MKLHFLGTCGGRYATAKQVRSTGGIVVETGETLIHVDPGPGALVKTHEFLDSPLETEGVLVSHAHPDHASDAEPIIEMVTEVGSNPGHFFTSKSVLEGHGDIEKSVSEYHKNLCQVVENLNDKNKVDFRDVRICSQEMFHSDPTTLGFTLETDDKKVGFWTDTEFSEELLDFYDGCDWLVVYCTRPRNSNVPQHTSMNDLPDIAEAVEPEVCFVTHFGMKFLNSDMEEEESWLEEKVDCKVIFAEDGMKFPGERSLDSFR